MSPGILLRALTDAQRTALADYAAALGVTLDVWPRVPALREYVEQLAVANTVARLRSNPTTQPCSACAAAIRAAQLLGLKPGTVRQRQRRAQAAAQAGGEP